jgi:hypothetical protein
VWRHQHLRLTLMAVLRLLQAAQSGRSCRAMLQKRVGMCCGDYACWLPVPDDVSAACHCTQALGLSSIAVEPAQAWVNMSHATRVSHHPFRWRRPWRSP